MVLFLRLHGFFFAFSRGKREDDRVSMFWSFLLSNRRRERRGEKEAMEEEIKKSLWPSQNEEQEETKSNVEKGEAKQGVREVPFERKYF